MKGKKTSSCRYIGVASMKGRGASLPPPRTYNSISHYFHCGDSVSPGTRFVMETSAFTPCEIQDIYGVEGGVGSGKKMGKKQVIRELANSVYASQVVKEYIQLLRHSPRGAHAEQYFNSVDCSTVYVHPNALIRDAQIMAFKKAGFRHTKSGMYRSLETR